MRLLGIGIIIGLFSLTVYTLIEVSRTRHCVSEVISQASGFEHNLERIRKCTR